MSCKICTEVNLNTLDLNKRPQKLSTRQIFERNQIRVVPTGFEQTYLWLHNIRSMHNVGSAFRSADAFGINGIILSGYTPIPPRPEISKTALGADDSVSWKSFSSVDEALNVLRANNYTLIGLEQTDNSNPISDLVVNSSDKLCLIMGNEVSGVDDELLQHIETFIEIPQYGQKHSFNVSVAAGIALFALHEQFKSALKA